MTITNEPGIYVLESPKDFYVGLTSRLRVRRQQHFSELGKNVHRNPKMQNIFNKGHRLVFRVLELCEEDLLEDRELYWFNKYKDEHPEKEALNLKECGSRPTYSYEARERISKGKAIKEYDYEKRYIVYHWQTEEILYVGDILDISKTLGITINNILRIEESWNDILGCSIKIIEELDDSILEWLTEENYFEGIL